MKDSGEWGSSCTRICCTLSSFRLIKLYIKASIARVDVRIPLPITNISSRAICTSPPSMVNLRRGSDSVVQIQCLGVKSGRKVENRLHDDRLAVSNSVSHSTDKHFVVHAHGGIAGEEEIM